MAKEDIYNNYYGEDYLNKISNVFKINMFVDGDIRALSSLDMIVLYL